MSRGRPVGSVVLEQLLDSLHEGLQVVDHEFRYVYANDAAARHGRKQSSELIGRTMMECYPGVEQTEMFALLGCCLRERSAHVLENEFRFADGTSAFFELRVEPVPQGACVLSIDVSERKRVEASLRESEERLRHAERMEAVGLLAAGISHDFNNLLSVILGHAEHALTRAEGPRREDLEGVMAAAGRSAALTRQLLAYGRRQVMRSEVVDVARLITGLETILRRTLDADVQLSLRIAEQVGTVEVDPSKLEQVIMNLVLNARDALPRGGTITLAVDQVELDADYVQRHPGMQPGPHIRLSVSDTGVGMDAETLARIFEPFFTTKAQGKGTGLGLATVYGIVKQSGGDIWVYSEIGHGTTFKVYLPRSTRAAPPPAPRAPVPIASAPAPSTALVLVAEDDDLLRTLAEDTLVAAGYRVLVAASGDEALRLCESQRPITLLITDVVMPGLRGPELIVAARKTRPTLKVLCTSGYAVAALEEQRELPVDVTFLEKPYLPSALVTTVRQILGSS